MPRLNSSVVTTTRYMLPSTSEMPEDQQAWVELTNSTAVREMTQISEAAIGVVAQGAGLLAGMIKAWNFTDENDQPVPVNYDNVLLMDGIDYTYLITVLNEKMSKVGLSTDAKKNLS